MTDIDAADEQAVHAGKNEDHREDEEGEEKQAVSGRSSHASSRPHRLQ